MFLFINLLGLGSCKDILYSSAFELKNVYTKNRIGVKPQDSKFFYENLIYSSRPPYSDDWFWTIEPDEDNPELARTPIKCGSIVALSNTINGVYLSTKNTTTGIQIVPSDSNQGVSSQWYLLCRNSTIWQQNAQIQLQNVKYKCFLSTNLENKIPNRHNMYQVNCTGLSKFTVWKSAEGIFFEDKPVRTNQE